MMSFTSSQPGQQQQQWQVTVWEGGSATEMPTSTPLVVGSSCSAVTENLLPALLYGMQTSA